MKSIVMESEFYKKVKIMSAETAAKREVETLARIDREIQKSIRLFKSKPANRLPL